MPLCSAREVLSGARESAHALVLLGRVYTKQGKFTEARLQFEEALRYEPGRDMSYDDSHGAGSRRAATRQRTLASSTSTSRPSSTVPPVIGALHLMCLASAPREADSDYEDELTEDADEDDDGDDELS